MRYSAAQFPFIISTRKAGTGEDVETLIRNNEKKLTEILTKMVFLESSLDEILEQEENEPFFLSMIPILDNLDAACRSASESESESEDSELAKGLEIIKKKLIGHFSSRGFSPTAEPGMKFDPRYHEAVGVESKSGEPGLITDVIAQGWLLNARVLRFAKVIITK